MIRTGLILALGTSLLSACTSDKPRQHLTLESVRDCPATLAQGQSLTISLPSNPTTGFRWQVQNPAPGILRSLGPEVFSTPEHADQVGAPGLSTWRYKAAEPGTGHLIMVYRQPWAPEVAPEQTFDCVITVK